MGADAFAGAGDRTAAALPLAAAGLADAFFLAFFAPGAASSGALATLRLGTLPLGTLPLGTLPLAALPSAFFAFFAGRGVARALLAGERLLAFAFDRFFAAMSILIIRYRDR